uniref:SDR family NAD(P)-dependent oxidoreductase n=1 Tax=Serratia marcescens TaxID=615 RepID=UPI0013DA87CD
KIHRDGTTTIPEHLSKDQDIAIRAGDRVEVMTPGGGGVIGNLASIAGHLPLSPRNAYSASKAAMINLTGCMAAELAPERIRVVAVAPG